MPRDLDLDFEFQDEGVQQRPRRQAPAREGGSNAGMPRGGAPVRRKKNQTTSIIILAVEIVVLIALIVLFFVLKSKIDSTDSSSSASTSTEGTAEAGDNGGNGGGTDVDSDQFRLKCTKVRLAQDTNGSPAALIYFTFENKTDTPLSMNEVFQPSLAQTGQGCSTDVSLTEYPTEYENKDMQVASGQSVECCYAYGLFDLTSPITLTMHDNYSTYSDIGSTEIPISSN